MHLQHRGKRERMAHRTGERVHVAWQALHRHDEQGLERQRIGRGVGLHDALQELVGERPLAQLGRDGNRAIIRVAVLLV